jgi:predicted aspartyl protease
MDNFLAFTLKSTGILNMLQTDTLVLSNTRDTSKPYTPKMWRGLWDTGASKSSITKRIVDDLNLIPIGNTNISTANGIVTVNTYFVDFGLPNGVTIRNVLVSCADLGDDVDVLIGMDIIRHGDFAITNVNDHTTFSFRTPSIKEIDYVKESKELKSKNKD